VPTPHPPTGAPTDGVHRLDVVVHPAAGTGLDLLAAAVLPQARLLRDAGLGVHVERHGPPAPDLRLRLAGHPDHLPAAAERAAGAVRAQLRTAPAAGTVRVQPAGRGVGVRAQLLRLGLEPLADSVRSLLAAGEAPAARVELAVTALAVHAATHPRGLPCGTSAYRAATARFLAATDPTGRSRAALAAVWTAKGDVLTGTVAALADGADDPVGAGWAAWSSAAWAVCAAAAARGGLPAAAGDEHRVLPARTPGSLRVWEPAAGRAPGAPRRLAPFDAAGAVDASALVQQHADDALRRLLAVCGVQPVEHHLAAHLVTQAAQRLGDAGWQPGRSSTDPLRPTGSVR